MKLKPILKSGTTQNRQIFFDIARYWVVAATKLPGRHVTVDEHPGKGSVINVADTSDRRPPAPSGQFVTVTLDGVEVCPGCLYTEPNSLHPDPPFYPYFATLGNPLTLTDIGHLNGLTVLYGDYPGTGTWDLPNAFYFQIDVYSDATDCSGDPTSTGTVYVDLHLTHISGTWALTLSAHLLGQPIMPFFYGTSSGLTIPNTIDCSYWDGITGCAGHGGNAILVISS